MYFMLFGVKMVSKGGVIMSDDKARFTLRIPQDLYAEIKKSAESSKRSVIKEIEFILEQYYQAQTCSKDTP